MRVAIVLVGMILSAPYAQSQPDTNEYQVKAAFLFNFGKFIEWPNRSFLGGDTGPFSICVIGDDPFGTSLDGLRGKFIGHRPVAVWRIKKPEEGWRCQVVFVSTSEQPRQAQIFSALRGSNALVVGETPGFASSGGAIEFTLEDKHVRFTINPNAVQRAGLRASSQLLALATIVHDEQSGGRN